MSSVQKILYTLIAVMATMLITEKSQAQSGTASAVYYICAEQGFKLSGPTGFDNYLWTEGSTGMPGADSSNIQVQALGAANVGNTYVTKTYHLKVMNAGTCWSDEATYVLYILPKMELNVTGYIPPYCENLSHDIPLTVNINGGTGSSALVLPPGVSVKYDWIVEPSNSNFQVNGALWNAEILGSTNEATAQVVTPQTNAIDNNYSIKVQYRYPVSVNLSTDVVGNCSNDYTQNVHADPAPAIPSINYQAL